MDSKGFNVLRFVLILIVVFGLYCCGQLIINQLKSNRNTTEYIYLPADQKLIDIKWIEYQDKFWYLTRPLRDGELPEKYTFTNSYDSTKKSKTYVIIESSTQIYTDEVEEEPIIFEEPEPVIEIVEEDPIVEIIEEVDEAKEAYRNGLNTDSIPYETQKDYIYEFVFEIIVDGNYTMEPALILAMVEVESTYYWEARNGEHYGLMQINPKWQEERMAELGVEDLSANPYDNLRVGIDFVEYLFTQYSDPYDVLNVYNSGGTSGEPTTYSTKVMSIYERISKELEGETNG